MTINKAIFKEINKVDAKKVFMKHFYGDGACINNLKVNKSWVLRSCYIFMRIAPNFFMLNGSGEFLDDTEWKSIKDEDVFKAS